MALHSSFFNMCRSTDPIKISRLTLARTHRASPPSRVTAYVEWVLGESRSATHAFVDTEIDAETGALLRTQSLEYQFGSRVAFADMPGRQTAWTGDRREFIGRNGTLPAGRARAAWPLSDTVGAGARPLRRDANRGRRCNPAASPKSCSSWARPRRGGGPRRDRSYTAPADLDAVLARTSHAAGTKARARSQVKTPDRAMDLMLNGWLLYQTLACRFWARSAFYQASGAFGFRDQLQDGMALAACAPGSDARSTCCARPRASSPKATCSTGGCRIRATASAPVSPTTGSGWPLRSPHYVETTGDTLVLDEVASVSRGRAARGRTRRIAFFSRPISESASALRALRAGARREPGDRAARAAADGHRRLERRHEPRRREGRGRERLARLVPYAALTAFAPLALARGETDARGHLARRTPPR